MFLSCPKNEFRDWLPVPFWTLAERAGLKAMGIKRNSYWELAEKADIEDRVDLAETYGQRENGVIVAIKSFVKAARAAKEKRT
jgi:hypothetical protein